MNNNIISRISLVIYALVLLVFASGHFFNAAKMSNAIPSFIPGAIFWVYLTGVALILAAISFIINKQVRLAGLLLGTLLLIFAFLVHLPGMIHATEDIMKWQSMGDMLRDLAMAASAFYIGSKN